MILGREPIFMSKYIFNLLCDYIKEQRRIIPYGRLLSDIFYQSSIIEQLEEMKNRRILENHLWKSIQRPLSNTNENHKEGLVFQHNILSHEV